jgi:hypothetical protein
VVWNSIWQDGDSGGIFGRRFERPVLVELDIGRRAFPMRFIRHRRIWVRVLTTPAFDATAIEPTSVRFGGTGTEAFPNRWRHKDVDADGDTDLVLGFRRRDTGIQCGPTVA